MKNACSGTERLGRGSSTTKKNHFQEWTSLFLLQAFTLSPLCAPASVRKRQTFILPKVEALKPSRAAAIFTDFQSML